jgi:glycosyltransferase
MKFSIITVCYNSEKTINHCISSVLSQTGVDIEYILIDGASNDSTLSIIRSIHDPRIYLISEPDNGLYHAMNKGIALAKGDFIGILNSDDYYAGSNILQIVRDCFLNNPEVDGVYGDLVYVDRTHSDKTLRRWMAGRYHPEKLFFGWMPPHPSLFLKRQTYQEIGLFNLNFKSAADYELILRACLVYQKKLIYQPGVFVKMRAGGMSNSSFKNRLKANKEDALAWTINGLKPPAFLRLIKPLRKISQFIRIGKQPNENTP